MPDNNLPNYTLHSTSRSSSRVDDVILSETSTTRLIMRPDIVANQSHPEAGVKITLVHQRKRPNGSWEDAPSFNLASLQAEQEVKLPLRTEQTLRLYESLRDLYAIHAASGVVPGHQQLAVGPTEEMLRVDTQSAEAIRAILERQDASDIWRVLAESSPDDLTRLSLAHIQSQRQEVLDEFEREIENIHDEAFWQDFFDRNQWIFGYGLHYRILRHLQDQPHYGGMSVAGSGTQRGDTLTASDGDLRFSVLVEIKTPQALLVGNAAYRNGAHLLARDVVGGLVQLQINAHTWESRGSTEPHNMERLASDGIHTVDPRSILVVGRTQTLDTLDKRESFERFRNSIHNTDIITFDELLARARFIVGQDPYN